jgi:hypothetical protein
MKLSNFLWGNESSLSKKTNYLPGQEKGLNQLLQNMLGLGGAGGGYQQSIEYLQNLLNPDSEMMKNFEEPYMRQFEQETLPNIAERFAGGGALSSSGFGQAVGGAGANLQSQLAQLKSMLRGQAAQGLMGQYNQMQNMQLGSQPFSYHEKQASPGIVMPLLSSFLQGYGGTF